MDSSQPCVTSLKSEKKKISATCPNASEEMKHYPNPEDLSEVTTIKGIKDKAKKLKQSLKDGTFTIDQL